MKKIYRTPKIEAVRLSSDPLLNGSWPQGDTGGVNPNPGGQGSFSARSRYNIEEEEYDDASIGW